MSERCPHDLDLRYCALCREHSPSATVPASVGQAEHIVVSDEHARVIQRRGDAGPPSREARL